MRTIADVIVARLKAAGVRAFFGVPGGGSNLDIVAAAGRAHLPFILTSTETGGAIAAEVQADLTGHPGACLTTLGPGAASVMNGVACALLERSPVVIFTDSHATRDHGRFQHQDVDHHGLMRAVVKHTERLTPEAALGAVDRAIAKAMTGEPGPVHLDCPGDVLSAPAAKTDRSKAIRTRRIAVGDVATRPARSALARAKKLISRARKPIVIVGVGARRAADANALSRLCSARSIPAMVTYKAKGVVADAHPWFAGVFMNAKVDQAVVADADLIIGIGLDPVELLPKPWPFSAPVVLLNPWKSPLGQVPATVALTIEVAGAIKLLHAAAARTEWRQPTVAGYVAAQKQAIALPTPGLSAQTAIEILAGRFAATHRLTVDAGAHMLPATMIWPCRAPHGLLISNGLATMGYSVPAAIGSAMTDPKTPVMAFIGDGGLLMCAGELLTLVRGKLRVTVVVFNDTSLSLIEIKQIARRLKPAGVALGRVNWAEVAAGMGLASFTATDADGLTKAADEAAAVDGPVLIDVHIDRSNYPAIFKAIRGG